MHSPSSSADTRRRAAVLFYAGINISQHQLTFQEVLGLAHMRGKLPRWLHLIGVQPADLAIGIGMSGVVTAALPQVVERAVTVLRAWELAM